METEVTSAPRSNGEARIGVDDDDDDEGLSPTDLSEMLAEGTKESHDRAENCQFVKDFLRGRIKRELFKRGTAALYFVYSAMEEEIEKNKDHPQIAPIYFPIELHRHGALARDLEHFYGEDWESQISLSAGTKPYVDRIHEVGEKDPVLLVAHSYTRYMGDLSGGQILKKVAQRGLNLPSTGEGLNFDQFEGIHSHKGFKHLYHSTMNELELDAETKERIVDESNRAFGFNMMVFTELEETGKIIKEEVQDAGFGHSHAGIMEGEDINKCPYYAAKMEHGNLRLIGGSNRCAGDLEMNLHNRWKPVDDPSFGWNLRISDTLCKQLDCGSAVSAKIKDHHLSRLVWKINTSSVWSDFAPREYAPKIPKYSFSSVELTCSESVRLVNGTTLCSGKVEIRADQLWSTVCEGDFDWQDAEIVCRGLGCGTPSKIHRFSHENIETPKWIKEFRCRENESTLLDCDSYESARKTCSPVGLTCSEPDYLRLMGGGGRCAGRLEMKLSGHWKPVDGSKGLVKSADLVCRQLKCGSAVSTKINTYFHHKSVWGIISSRVQSVSALREYVSLRPWFSSTSLEVACSDLLYQPMISISPSFDWVYKSSTFTITCSIKPQYPGGFFELTILTTSYTTQMYTKKAVNHSAHFLFPAADHVHQGNYSCVYHIYVFSHNFYSKSKTLSLSVSASPVVFFTRLAGLLLTLALFLAAICFYKKATRGQEMIEQDMFSLYASRAEDGLNDAAVGQESAL